MKLRKRSRRYGSNQIAASAGSDRQRAGESEHAAGHAGHDEHAEQHQRERDRRPEIRLQQEEPGEDARDEADRAPQLAERPRHALPRDVGGGGEEERELRELGGLERCRAEVEPAAGAVHLGRDDEERRTEHDRAEDERRREQPQAPVVEARGRDQQHDAEDGVDRLPLQVRHRVAFAERCRGRRGAVDHHEPERDERQRHEDEQALLELAFHTARFSTSLLNSSPRCSKSLNWS